MDLQYTDKQPLLPEHGHCQCCYEQGNCRKPRNRFLRACIAIVLFILGFHVIGHYYRHHQLHHHYRDGEDLLEASISTHPSCWQLHPDIPWNGKSVYTVSDAYDGLRIKQKHPDHINVRGGQVDVYVNHQVSETTVIFDIKLSSEIEQDVVDIVQQDEEDGTYSLIITDRQDGDSGLVKACIQLDITVYLPNADALGTLEIALANNNINIHDYINVSEALSLAVANGDIKFENVTAGAATVSVANGNVAGLLHELQGALTSTTARGDIDIRVLSLNVAELAKITLTSSYGTVTSQFPDKVNSSFELNTVIGKIVVTSKENDKLHITEAIGRRRIRGYYGSQDGVLADINLTTVYGGITLKFA